MENKKYNELINLIKRNINLADLGCLYAHNGYDDERYHELKEINLKILSLLSAQSLEEICKFYLPIKEYPTPKIDIRGVLLDDENRILMVEEKLDPGKWSLPGGWADIGFTPSEVIKKEMKEETGLNVEVIRILAVYDKKCHPHPQEPFYTYKIVFLCKKIDGELRNTFDIDDVKFFDINSLPPLSEARILESQVKQLYNLAINDIRDVYFD